MSAAENIEKLIKKFCIAKKSSVTTSPGMDKRVLDDALAAYGKSKMSESADSQPFVWRIIMKSKITKLATAAVIIIAVLLSITVLDKSVAPAYALEHTIKASCVTLGQTIRYVHYVWTYWENGEQVIREEVWQKLDMNNQELALRVDKGRERVITISENHIRKEWNPESNVFELQYEYLYPAKGNFRSKWREPALAALLLDEWEKLGRVSLEITQPDGEDEPIRVIASYTEEYLKTIEGSYARQYVLLIDPETKLVIQSEIYRPPFTSDSLQERYIFVGYNEPFDPAIFDLVQPERAEVVDLTQDVGLSQGQLSAAETARQVVRQYLEALIAKDYEKAARLHNGVIPEHLKERTEGIKYLRVIDIGVPELDQSGLPGYLVPYKFEIESGGVRMIVGHPKAFSFSEPGPIKHHKAAVRPVPGHSESWMIYGGI